MSNVNSVLESGLRRYVHSVPNPRNSVKERVDELRAVISRADEEYYGAASRVSLPDAEYDKLFRELVRLEAKYPELHSPTSPTQRVGAARLATQHRSSPRSSPASVVTPSQPQASKFETRPHSYPMLSVNTVFDPNDLRLFVKSVQRATAKVEAKLSSKLYPLSNKLQLPFFVELKFDGLALALRYVKGHLALALTRGDGKEGQVLTEAHLKYYLPSIPHSLDERSWQQSFLRSLENVYPELAPVLQAMVQHIEANGPVHAPGDDWIAFANMVYPHVSAKQLEIMQHLESSAFSRVLLMAGDYAQEDDFIEIRGECIMMQSVFQSYLTKLKSHGLPTYANPRNLTSGLFHRDSESIEEEYEQLKMAPEVKFLAYNLAFPMMDFGQDMDSIRIVPISWVIPHSQRIKLLRDGLRFPVDPFAELVHIANPELPQVEATLDHIPGLLRDVQPSELPIVTDSTQFVVDSNLASPKERIPDTPKLSFQSALYPLLASARARLLARSGLAVDCDGVVIKADSIPTQLELGNTGRAVRWALAMKETRSTATSTLTSVSLQVGRTGRVVPVATVEPTEMNGAVITKVTLHNCDYLKNSDLAIGDEVVIERRGDIIPSIVGHYPRLDSTTNNPRMRVWDTQPRDPTTSCILCPCERKTPLNAQVSLRASEGTATGLFCTESPHQCPAQSVRSLEHFSSKAGGLGIDGLGPATVEKFLDGGILTSCPSSIVKLGFDPAMEQRLRAFAAQTKGMGPKQATNVLNSIRSTLTNATADKFLRALGVSSLGQVRSERILESLYLEFVSDVSPLSQAETTANLKQLAGLEVLYLAHARFGEPGLEFVLSTVLTDSDSSIKLLAQELASAIQTSISHMLPYADAIPVVKRLQHAREIIAEAELGGRVDPVLQALTSRFATRTNTTSTNGSAKKHKKTRSSTAKKSEKVASSQAAAAAAAMVAAQSTNPDVTTKLPLQGHTIVITGQFEMTAKALLLKIPKDSLLLPVVTQMAQASNSEKALSRNDVADLIRVSGGTCVDSVTKKVTRLVDTTKDSGVESRKSTKWQKATKLNIPILGENEFWSILLGISS